jgi:hypothetical protein
MLRARAVCFLAFGLLLACPKAPSHSDAGDAPSASASAAPFPSGGDDEVHPVYPKDVRPEPLAFRLCLALYDTPEQKRAACCNTAPQTVVTSECVRMLSYALHSKALLLTDVAVDRCTAALDKVYDGCDWPGPSTPELPDECKDITKGTVGKGALCRSSLECAGDLYCRGVGPTQAGVCDVAGEPGAACNLSVDALAGYIRQVPVERAHPECHGTCNRHRCIAVVPEGGACKDRIECGPNMTCKAGNCVAAVIAKKGQACPDGACEPGADCIAGRCLVRKSKGSDCAIDFECIGGCNKPDGGSRGTCGPKCSVR